jgi:hypothetical protein
LIDSALLEETRMLPNLLCEELQAAARPFHEALRGFEQRAKDGIVRVADELERLVSLWRAAAGWIEGEVQHYPSTRPDELFFIDHILLDLAKAHHERAGALLADARDVSRWSAARIEAEYQLLAKLFDVSVTGFERKLYSNLSHESNKAMNLNSYIGLMGRCVKVQRSPDGSLQIADSNNDGELVPDARYIITLDADSLLRFDYAMRLVDVMESSGKERLAVIQTPYSAFTGATTQVERIAGATTDIQYLIHQGFTRYNSTYWVGANALLRKSALEDVATEDIERGFRITRYIQDRTVIEDTESTVDLVSRGWSLFNYPERMAHSATPPDFGALLIQRRRWANGGLIIFPKLIRYLTRPNRVPNRLGHAFVGIHYLVSIALVNLASLALMGLPVFDASLRSPWLPLSALPYFLIFARDLRQSGYRRSDALRVYALNLLLMPVNIGGVLKSVQQLLTGRRTPFARTPKVTYRTMAPPIYILSGLALCAVSAVIAMMDVLRAHWWHGAFASLNAVMLAYALDRFVGADVILNDLRAGMFGGDGIFRGRNSVGSPGNASGDADDGFSPKAV